MNESTLTQHLLAELKTYGYFVMKHSDRFQVGIPDASASKHGLTTWLELKYHPTLKNLEKINFEKITTLIGSKKKVQFEYLRRLERHASALYVLWTFKNGILHTLFFRPSFVFMHLGKTAHIELALSPPEAMTKFLTYGAVAVPTHGRREALAILEALHETHL